MQWLHDCNDHTQFYYNRNAAYLPYVVRQKVLLHDPVTKKGISKKLKKCWTGPYLVTKVGDGYTYKLRHCDSGQILKAFVHSNRLRPFNEPKVSPKAPSIPQMSDNTSSDSSDGATANTSTTLPDGWFQISKITNRKNIAGKIHYMLHWSDGTKSYEPKENISYAAKAAYHALCQARWKPRDHQ